MSRTTVRPCFVPKYVPHSATYAVLPSGANAIPPAAECGSRYATGGVTPAQPVPASCFRFQLGQQPGQPKLRPCETSTSISAGSSPRSSRPFTVT